MTEKPFWPWDEGYDEHSGEGMTAEIRLSPDGRDVAIRNRDDRYFPWRVTDGSQRTDRQIADWTVLRRATA